MIRLNRVAHRVVICVMGALSMGSSCEDPEDDIVGRIDDNKNTPLDQESSVLVEIDVPDVGWVVMPVPQAGIEKFARKWCAHSRMVSTGEDTDSKLCENTPGSDLWEGEFDDDDATILGADPGFELCAEVNCRARNEVCAGLMLEDMARSPVARVFDVGGAFTSQSLGELGISTSAREAALAKANAPRATTTTTKIRFQPMEAPGRAAALRGAFNTYREAVFMGMSRSLLI